MRAMPTLRRVHCTSTHWLCFAEIVCLNGWTPDMPVEQPTWGAMIRDGQAYYLRAPWVIAFPGLAVLFTVAGFNLLAMGARRPGGH